MPIAVTDEHEELRRSARRWLDAHCPPAVPRASLDAAPTELPSVWKALADQGWLGLHLPEADGGQGAGLAGLAVVLDELGYSAFPGPLLATLVASAVIDRWGDAEVRAALLPGLADGSTPAAVHLGPGRLAVDGGGRPSGGRTVGGRLRPVLGAPTAAVALVPVDGRGWCVLRVDGEHVRSAPLEALDPTQPVGTLEVTAAPVTDQCWVASPADGPACLALVLASAAAAGGARWCLETARRHALGRVQFGRPIGQFQAVKHKLADMLVVAEEAAATAWDAAGALDGGADAASSGAGDGTSGAGDGTEPLDPDQSLAAAVAGLVALDAFVRCAEDCVQVLGGIGFTWEHDAHIYLRRALAGRQLVTGEGDLAAQVVGLALGGARRSLSVQLPPEADGIRATIGPLVESAARLSGDEQRRFLVDHGLLAPHWPAPWGRDAGPLEQLVIDEALSAHRVQRPGLAVGAWAVPTLIAHGTPAQQERLVTPTLLGAVSWCQLFSEPGAGSDLASLTTRAEAVEGGWRLNGQKVWTSLAQSADWGICLARTDPDVPKHEGITYFLVDMTTPGIDVRPLRELTGSAMFNEVFLDDVVVPDECVVGRPGQGWAIARTTLANERVFMSSGSAFGIGVESVLRRLAELGERATPAMLAAAGHLLAEAQALRLMGHLATLRSLSGVEPGAGASVRKLLGAEHEQRVQELGLRLHGADGAVLDGEAQRWGHGFLATRCLTIAGGTSEVQRNVMAERLLGLPRDPEPSEGSLR